MAPSVFLDKSEIPPDRSVAEVLGRAAGLWAQLRASLGKQYEPLVETWKYSGAKYGWSLQLKQKKRAVVYLIPQECYFTAAFAFGEKAASAARASDLPAGILAIIDSAPKYPEGRAVRIEVRAKKDVDAVTKLAAIKMANCAPA